MSYSQNKEDLQIAGYFGKRTGTLLELGANDGRTFSNSLYLIERGWQAHLVEPSSVYSQLKELHEDRYVQVKTHKCAIDVEDYTGILYESGAHVKNGTDKALVSTLDINEMSRWQGVEFNSGSCACLSFDTFYTHIDRPKLDFISIDIEGMDWQVLQQINLHEVGCSCLCIEWNSKQDLLDKYTAYTKEYDMRILHINAENVIYVV